MLPSHELQRMTADHAARATFAVNKGPGAHRTLSETLFQLHIILPLGRIEHVFADVNCWAEGCATS